MYLKQYRTATYSSNGGAQMQSVSFTLFNASPQEPSTQTCSNLFLKSRQLFMNSIYFRTFNHCLNFLKVDFISSLGHF